MVPGRCKCKSTLEEPTFTPEKTSKATELLEVIQKTSVYDDQEEETMKQQKPSRTSDNEVIKDRL